MEFTKEEYTNKEGKKVVVERFLGNKSQCVLTDGKKAISPMVMSIEYDEEHDVFFVIDDYRSVDEFGQPGEFSARVYFYMDFDGEPIGMAYTDAFDGLFVAHTRHHKEDGSHDRWFTAYTTFKQDLGYKLACECNARIQHLGECAEKMLELHTNPERK